MRKLCPLLFLHFPLDPKRESTSLNLPLRSFHCCVMRPNLVDFTSCSQFQLPSAKLRTIVFYLDYFTSITGSWVCHLGAITINDDVNGILSFPAKLCDRFVFLAAASNCKFLMSCVGHQLRCSTITRLLEVNSANTSIYKTFIIVAEPEGIYL